MADSSFLVGIDLGTSRSAIVTEDGQKAFIETIVGWPKDVIGIKIIGKAIVFGQEALDFRDSLDICFPLSDGVINEGSGKDEEAAEELIKHLLSLVNIPDGKKISGVVGVPARASAQSKKTLKEIAKKCMHDVMLISEPFSIAYKTEKLSHSIIIDIGAGTTDFCAMRGRIPDEHNQVTIKKAGNMVDQVLFDALRNKFPDTQLTLKIAKRLKEEHGTVITPDENIIVLLRVAGKLQAHNITEEIVESCSILVPDIVEEVEKMIIGFDPDFQEAAMENLILAGGMSVTKGLKKTIEENLKEYGNVKVHIAGDSLYSGAEGALMLGRDVPVQFWGQIGDLGDSED
ncbi:MAG: rod shape-determining protein [Nitrospinae bacterium]|nr:rod shape-determining protein [Nitrospinota bacterium]